MIKRILPLAVVVCLLVACLSFSASAAVIDPSDYGDYVVSGDTIIYNISNQFDLFYWRRLHDGSLSTTGTGKHFVYTTQMRYVDNDQIYLYPFGYNSSVNGGEFVDLNSYPLGSAISFKADFELTIPASTQSYGTDLRIYWQFFDVDKNSLGFNSKAFPLETGQSLRIYQIDETFSTTNPNARYFSCYLMWDFSGVANESDTTSVQVDTNTYTLSISFPVDRLGQLIDQGKLTNKQLGDIDEALQENGQKLDDVLKEQQSSNDKLDEIINGTVPDVRPDGSDIIDDMGKAESDLMDDIGSNLDDAIDIQTDALSLLNQYLTAFAAATFIFECFSTLPFFSVLLTVSLSLSVIAVLFSLSASLGRASGRGSSGKRKGG